MVNDEGGHLQIGMQLQIYIWVVLFDHNLGSSLALVPSMSQHSWIWGMSSLDPDPALDPYLGCTFLHGITGLLQNWLWSHVCLTITDNDEWGHLQIWIWLQIHIWVVLFDLNFHCVDIMYTLCYLQNSTFCPTTPFQMVRFEKFLHKQGLFFLQMIILNAKNLYYLDNWTFCPIYLFILILFALCVHKPYILLLKCNFGSIEWQFGTYCFYVDLEAF